MTIKITRTTIALTGILILAVLLSAFASQAYAIGERRLQAKNVAEKTSSTDSHASTGHPQAVSQTAGSQISVGNQTSAQSPTVSFTLETGMADGRMVFISRNSETDGAANPDLNVNPGDVVEIILVNGDAVQHNIALPDFNAKSADVVQKSEETRIVFVAEQEGVFPYFCDVPGHRQAGMEGKLIVGVPAEQGNVQYPSVARSPDDLPAPVTRSSPETVHVELETVELEGRLADGTAYNYWTFNGQVPGPFIRVRVGDTLEVSLKNSTSSTMIHSVDFHAATGPGGGAVATQTNPGGETHFSFKALNPGLFVYHCATPMVAHHISNGMYGLILVEPEGGLPPVDSEYYVMQGEIYTAEPLNKKGVTTFSQEKLLDESPEYVVFNSSVGALTQEHPLQANVGETVRIFFGVGGPNLTSSFHVIGEIFDRVYDQASLTAAPLTDVQTTIVPTGGAAMVEFRVDVPGRYILVDHSLSRLERGLAGFLIVEGAEAPEIFNGVPTAGSGH
jgi:nitrite reductase (NO-forming)